MTAAPKVEATVLKPIVVLAALVASTSIHAQQPKSGWSENYQPAKSAWSNPNVYQPPKSQYDTPGTYKPPKSSWSDGYQPPKSGWREPNTYQPPRSAWER